MSEKFPETSFHQHGCHLRDLMMMSLHCQLGYAIVPHYFIKHLSCCESIFVDVVNIYNQLTLSIEGYSQHCEWASTIS